MKGKKPVWKRMQFLIAVKQRNNISAGKHVYRTIKRICFLV